MVRCCAVVNVRYWGRKNRSSSEAHSAREINPHRGHGVSVAVRGARVAAEAKYAVAEPFWAGEDPAGRFRASFSPAILRLPCAKFVPVAGGHDYASETGIFQAI